MKNEKANNTTLWPGKKDMHINDTWGVVVVKLRNPRILEMYR